MGNRGNANAPVETDLERDSVAYFTLRRTIAGGRETKMAARWRCQARRGVWTVLCSQRAGGDLMTRLSWPRTARNV